MATFRPCGIAARILESAAQLAPVTRYRRLLRIDGELPGRLELRDMEKACEAENRKAQTITDRLKQLSDETNMPVTQENGQRCFGPPRDWEGPAPVKGSEVFVGNLPRDVFEPHLWPVFSKVGQIYKIRLMMDFSGTNRGYCFVQYTTPEEAQRAVRQLNGYELGKGRKIGVMKSVDNCRLFLGGLPKDKTEEEIYQEICRHTTGVRRVIAYPSAEDKTKNRGFAFVEYESHKTAAMARRKLIPGNITLWDHEVCVDWAEPEPEVDPEIMTKVKNLYVRNLMMHTTEERLRQIFNEVSENGVEKVKKIKDYAFVHFVSREQADAARIALNNTDIDGAQVEISWAKPVDKSGRKSKSPKQRRSNNGSLKNFSPSPTHSFSEVSQWTENYSPYSPALSSPYSYLPVSSLFSPMEFSAHGPYYGYPSGMLPMPNGSPNLDGASQLDAVQALADFCVTNGFAEPVYVPHTTQTTLEGPLFSYKVRIYSRSGALYREFVEDSYFPSEEYAKLTAAEKALRQLLFSPYVPLTPPTPTVPFILTQPNSMMPF